MTIAVVIKGGIVDCVVTDEPFVVGQSVTVVDYDTEGADPKDPMLSVVPQGCGSTELAWVRKYRIEEAEIDIKGIRAMTEAEPGEYFL